MHRVNCNSFRASLTLGLSLLAAVAGLAPAAQGMTTDNWRLNLNVASDGTPDNSTQLGTDPKANNGWDDSYDFFNPPAIGDNYVDAYFTHGNTDIGWQGVGGTYATDIRYPVQEDRPLEWDNLNIDVVSIPATQSADVTVTWPGIADVPASVKLALSDPNDLNNDGVREYDMRAVNSFRFSSPASGLVNHYLLGVSATLVGGTPPPHVKGDVNGDSKVNAQDATLALRAAVGILQLAADQKDAADVVKDGKVNVQDATLILRAAVGLVSIP
jgi:hypothetical protein